MDHMMNDHMANEHMMYDHFRLPLPAQPGQPLSEFNHHLAGLFLLIIGISAILMYMRPQRFGYLKYVWPASFLLLGIYILVYGEPYAWPSGYMSIAQSWADPGMRQHKMYALLLIAIGAIELGRAANWLKADAWKYAFPALGAFGGLFLLVHHHGGGPGTSAETHIGMKSMALIQAQHIAYLIVGLGLVISKVLYDTRKLTKPWAPYIWPTLTIVLGLLLIFYTEG